MGLIFAACSATYWTDTLFFLIHHVWSRWLVVALGLLTVAGYGLVSWPEAAAGVVYGYGLLWILRALFLRLRSLDALGEGDPEFICVIALGAGLYGVWLTLLGASLLGMLVATISYLFTREWPERIPLASYMALVGSGAVVAYQMGLLVL
jgi:prepilin signal peptidase PulO-like enzyme (type II secretory pathway)